MTKKCHNGTSAYQSEPDCLLQEVILVQTFLRHVVQTTKIQAVVEFKLFIQDILNNTLYCIINDIAAYFWIM